MTADPISLVELARLVKLLGMLGSAHPGERAAAALKASEWVRDHSTTWAALLEPPEPNAVVSVSVGEPPAPRPAPPPARPAPPPPPPPPPIPTGKLGSWVLVAHALLMHYDLVFIGDRERTFVQERIQKSRFKLTSAQEQWLRDIADRAGLSW